MGAFDVGQELDETQVREIEDSDYRVRISDYFRRGWELFTRNPGNLIGFLVLSGLISAAATVVPFGGFLLTPLTAGYYIFIFKIIKDEPAEFGDFFKGFNYFLPIVISSLLVGIFVTIGFILLVLPGIYLAVGYLFVMPFIVDKGMHFWQAMEVSRKLISKDWFSFFVLVILLALLNFVGALLLLVGLLVTIPWSICAMSVAYADIVGLGPAEGEPAVIEQ